jgi:hypothetical protein
MFRMILPGLWVALLLGGCSTAGYRAPVAQFNEAAAIVVETSRVYITQVNKVERDIYIDGQVAAGQPIDPKEIQARALLTPDEIELRLSALDELTRYGNLLLKLANSDAPDTIAERAEGLGKAVDKLSADVNTRLGRPENAGFKNAMGPVTSVISQVARLAAERKIQEALNAAVKAGEKPVTNLLDVLSEETLAAYERKRTYLSRSRTWAVDAYNEEARKGERASKDALKKYAGQIRVQLDEWDAFAAARPQDSFAAFAEAHVALVAYANSPKTPRDLNEFVSEMERFLYRAKKVEQAMRKLYAM